MTRASVPRPSKWGPRTPKPDVDPRECLRFLEGVKVGIYDLTTLPTHILEEALTLRGEFVTIRIPGRVETHMVSRSSVETVLQAKVSHTHPVVNV